MVTLALVGAGTWGRNYLTAAERISGVRIKYLVVRNEKSVERFPSKYTVYTDIEQLYQHDDIGGVIIATPSSTHSALAKELLQHKYNLLIEKPFAQTIDAAKEIETLWRQYDSKVLVGHVQLYNPAYLACKRFLPEIGNSRKISFEGLGSPPRIDVSVLWDWGPHPASILLDLIDAQIENISASGSNEEAHFSLQYKNGIIADAHIAWQAEEKKRELMIEGENGTIIFDDRSDSQKKVRLERAGSSTFFEYNATPPLEVELREFVDAIDGKREIRSDVELGVRVTELLVNIENRLR
jgi:predicted dehydrogenase